MVSFLDYGTGQVSITHTPALHANASHDPSQNANANAGIFSDCALCTTSLLLTSAPPYFRQPPECLLKIWHCKKETKENYSTGNDDDRHAIHDVDEALGIVTGKKPVLVGSALVPPPCRSTFHKNENFAVMIFEVEISTQSQSAKSGRSRKHYSDV